MTSRHRKAEFWRSRNVQLDQKNRQIICKYLEGDHEKKMKTMEALILKRARAFTRKTIADTF